MLLIDQRPRLIERITKEYLKIYPMCRKAGFTL
jgi:hypothetical protein